MEADDHLIALREELDVGDGDIIVIDEDDVEVDVGLDEPT